MLRVKLAFVGWEIAEMFFASLPDNFLAGAVDAVEETSRVTRINISNLMPVDTGWAQERWGWEALGGVWEVSDNGLTIEQGSDIAPYEYIIRLNEGSSTQAPAGFIDVAAEDAGRMLENELERMIEERTRD